MFDCCYCNFTVTHSFMFFCQLQSCFRFFIGFIMFPYSQDRSAEGLTNLENIFSIC